MTTLLNISIDGTKIKSKDKNSEILLFGPFFIKIHHVRKSKPQIGSKFKFVQWKKATSKATLHNIEGKHYFALCFVCFLCHSFSLSHVVSVCAINIVCI